MIDNLKTRLAALRGVSPRINTVTNHTNEVIRLIEKTLVEDLNLAVSASVLFESEFGGEKGLTQKQSLAFGRVTGSGAYRIFVLRETGRTTSLETGSDASFEVIEEEQILWPSCGRELKLKAFHSFARTSASTGWTGREARRGVREYRHSAQGYGDGSRGSGGCRSHDSMSAGS